MSNSVVELHVNTNRFYSFIELFVIAAHIFPPFVVVIGAECRQFLLNDSSTSFFRLNGIRYTIMVVRFVFRSFYNDCLHFDFQHFSLVHFFADLFASPHCRFCQHFHNKREKNKSVKCVKNAFVNYSLKFLHKIDRKNSVEHFWNWKLVLDDYVICHFDCLFGSVYNFIIFIR